MNACRLFALLSLFLLLPAAAAGQSDFRPQDPCEPATKALSDGSSHETRIELLSRCLIAGKSGDYDKAAIYSNRGVSYYATGRYQNAVEDFDRAIELSPGDADYYNHRGAAYKKLGKPARAIQDFDSALGISENDPAIYNNRGAAYRELKEYENALRDFDRAVAIRPDYAKAYANRAFVLQAMGRTEQARSDAKKAKELDPKVTIPKF